jgi:beta-lactamase regulating signal transducer with metallopeptidase domain
MIWFPLQGLAQVSVERVLNALPEGIVVAFFAWALLRVLRRQNSGTRFAVWFVALLMVAGLPLLGGFAGGHAAILAGTLAPASSGSVRPAIAIPGGWAFFIFLAWAMGTGVLLARLAAGMWRLRLLGRSCTPVAAAGLDPVLQEAMKSITASGTVTIATSERVRVPAAIGFWKRTIVLPRWALGELAANDLRAILLHEFAHLRRRDDWSNLVQKIVRAVFFFHPAVWWIESRLAVEREMACDDAVLAETGNPRGYATCLVSLLEKSMAHRLSGRATEKRWSMAHAAVRRAHEASLRLARILDARRSTATRIWKPALAAMGIFSLLSLAALPHAPQLVVFDRGTARVDMGTHYGEPLPDAATAKIETAKITAAKVTTAKVVHAPTIARHQTAPAPVTAARLNSTPPAQVAAIHATANQEIVPQFETLVFIETTQYGTSTLSVWSVQVWRVALMVPRHDATTERVPVVNSI